MTAVLLGGVLLLVVLNGFFVAAEFALVRCRRQRVDAMVEQGRRGSRRLLSELDNMNEYLSSCQFGITLASLGIGFMGEPAIAALLEPKLGDVVSHGMAVIIAIAVSYLMVTALHITVGEQVPKVYALVNAEKVGLWVATPLHVFTVVMRPFIVTLNGASTWMLRRVGVHADAGHEEVANAQELRAMISQAGAGGHLDPGEAGMLSGVFHLHEQQARQVMTPIPAVVSVTDSMSVRDTLQTCVAEGHTRLLVVDDGDSDHVRGVVHASALVRALLAGAEQETVASVMRDAMIVPETKPLDDLLADLRRARTSIAVVADEYGRPVGIVTVEDIVEEIVGEIEDETDVDDKEVRRLPGGGWLVDGHVSITDLLDHGLHMPVDSEAYNSLGGFVFAELGRQPQIGDEVRVNGYVIRVEAVSGSRIETVKVTGSHRGR